jgi:septal ring factor EnvC (AmiA/AmiB activator)
MRITATLLLVTLFSLAGLTGCFKADVNVPDYSRFGQPQQEEPPPVPQAVPGDLASCHQEILALRTQNAQLRQQNEDFRGKVASQERKISDLKHDKDKLKDEVERLKDENKKLRKRLGND